MTANYKTLADFEVATAEEAQSYFMDQAIIKVDSSDDLAALPTTVKTAYVLNTGILMARNVANVWVPTGGAATVDETAPANPQVGQLWVKPSEVLPAPVRAMWGTQTITSTTANANMPTSATAAITLPKAAMCMVHMSGNVLVQGTAQSELFARLAWTGALAGDSQSVGGTSGVLYQRSEGTSAHFGSASMSFTLVLPAGTTTFQGQAWRAGSATTSIVYATGFSVTPLQWADAYVAGVS